MCKLNQWDYSKIWQQTSENEGEIYFIQQASFRKENDIAFLIS